MRHAQRWSVLCRQALNPHDTCERLPNGQGLPNGPDSQPLPLNAHLHHIRRSSPVFLVTPSLRSMTV